MTRVALLGIVVSVICVLQKRYFRESIIFLQSAFLVAVFLFAADYTRAVAQGLKEILGVFDEGTEIMKTILKGAVVCIGSKFAADICCDSGNTVVADGIDLASRLMIVALCLPYVEKIIEIAVGFAS